MGFFSDLWSGIKDTAGQVWSGVKDVASSVYNTAKSGVDWVASNVQPVVEAVGKYGGYIPVIGGAISGAAGTVNSLINQAKAGVDAVGKAGRGIGLLGSQGNRYSRSLY
jgi:phage-related protein